MQHTKSDIVRATFEAQKVLSPKTVNAQESATTSSTSDMLGAS
jgi:hypothetical protein